MQGSRRNLPILKVPELVLKQLDHFRRATDSQDPSRALPKLEPDILTP